jgi:TRAP-type C4-dicarboxylate transport system substrate-binding protein
MIRSLAYSLSIYILAFCLPVFGLMQASALELKGGLGAGPTHALIRVALPEFKLALQEYSGGDLTVTNYGLEVVTIQTAPDAIRSGLIDFGQVFPYEPALFPNFAMLLELGPVGTNGLAKAAATMEFVVTCDECLKEFTDSGSVYAGGGSTSGTDLLMVSEPIITLEDIKGKRLRNPGGYGTTFTEVMGAIPIQTPFSEEFATLQSGLADGTIAPTENLMGSRLFEIVRFHTPLNIGTYHTSGNFNVRNETWKAMSVGQREAWIKSTIRGVLAMTANFVATGNEGLEQMYARGGTSVEPSPELLAAVERFREISKTKAIEIGTERYGLNDADQKVRRFEAVYEKWEDRLSGIDTSDPRNVADLVWKEVWSKLDLTTYGEN